MSIEDARKRLEAPSNLGSNATKDISAALTVLLADVFALYVKTKNFHWHISGPHFRDYHLLLDKQAEDFRDAGQHRGKSAQDRRHNPALANFLKLKRYPLPCAG
jgi:hypothetical protein